MHRVVPVIAVPVVNFLVVETDATTPVKLVSQTGRVIFPNALNFLAPARLKHFIKIK